MMEAVTLCDRAHESRSLVKKLLVLCSKLPEYIELQPLSHRVTAWIPRVAASCRGAVQQAAFGRVSHSYMHGHVRHGATAEETYARRVHLQRAWVVSWWRGHIVRLWCEAMV